jgi:hypothetical protein
VQALPANDRLVGKGGFRIRTNSKAGGLPVPDLRFREKRNHPLRVVFFVLIRMPSRSMARRFFDMGGQTLSTWRQAKKGAALC